MTALTKIDRDYFYDYMRAVAYDGMISQEQVDGCNALLDEYEQRGWHREQWLAYLLATTLHETAFTMQPISEYGKGKGYSYGNPSPETGKVYYGRGYVQLTWDYNYQKAGDKIGVELYWHPELALKHEHAAKVIFQGMEEGWFTGKRLGDYITKTTTDYYNARKIVNGLDKASTIEGYAKHFEEALVQAESGEHPPLPKRRAKRKGK